MERGWRSTVFKRNSWFELQVESFSLLLVNNQIGVLLKRKLIFLFSVGKGRAITRREKANNFQIGQPPKCFHCFLFTIAIHTEIYCALILNQMHL